MHRLLLIAAVASLAAGCSNPCQDLGDEICRCNPGGVSEETCKREVDNAVSDVDPTKSQEEVCADLLDSCDAPSGVDFCDWLATEAGKQACGLSY